MGLNKQVTFSTAKLLKEKGFVNVCEQVYRSDGLLYTPNMSGSNLKHSNILNDESYSAPTIADVIDWLYEKHGIFVTVTIPYNEFGKFSAEIWGKESDNIKILLVDGMSVFNTINQAYEEGIIESLKLI